MKIRVTFDLCLADRRAISLLQGQAYPATHDDCKTYLIGTIEAALDEARSTLYEQEETK